MLLERGITMNCQLFRIRIDLEDGKYFYNFYIKTENGTTIKVNRNVFKDSNGNYHDNYQLLCACSKEIKDLKEIL